MRHPSLFLLSIDVSVVFLIQLFRFFHGFNSVISAAETAENHREGSSIRALCSESQKIQKEGGANVNVLRNRLALKQ